MFKIVKWYFSIIDFNCFPQFNRILGFSNIIFELCIYIFNIY